MRVGIIQSNYLPWRGYFDFIASVDCFVFHDDIQYTKGDWRNRNYIKSDRGPIWLTVPVHYSKKSQLICETTISYETDWRGKHQRQIESFYARAPFKADAMSIVEEAFAEKHATISDLNITLIKSICRYLEINTPLMLSSEIGASGSKTERLIGMLKKLKADSYLSGRAAEAYLDLSMFKNAGIGLEYKVYDYVEYPQQWGTFEPQVSVIDLIMNTGTAAKAYLQSQTPNEPVL